jgi:hypothetical protein
MKPAFAQRKGFDSEHGGYPSHILPDDKMVSLPILLPITTYVIAKYHLIESKLTLT